MPRGCIIQPLFVSCETIEKFIKIGIDKYKTVLYIIVSIKNYNLGGNKMIKVENMTSDRSGRAVPNQFVIKTSSKIVFQSYESTVAIFDRQTKLLKIYGGVAMFSKTTFKYFKQFIRFYIPYLFSEGEEIQKIINEVKKTNSDRPIYIKVERDKTEIIKNL